MKIYLYGYVSSARFKFAKDLIYNMFYFVSEQLNLIKQIKTILSLVTSCSNYLWVN